MTTRPSSQEVADKRARIEASLLHGKRHSRSLTEYMSKYRIPGVSVAVINNYQIEWAAGYGVRERGTSDPVDTETMFQACSISKPVAAVAALRLVEQGLLDLDTDINTYLTSWKVPKNGFWQPEVTLRQLLSHTAGISVPWFAGYYPEQDIPTLLEVLTSEQPANTPAIRVTTLPGLRFRYSGGGYCILQQLLMDITQQPFPILMHDLVFKPLDMQHSTYEQPYDFSKWRNVATGHRVSGKPVAGKWHIFPEMAAGGLWTTPSDLARLSLSLQRAIAGQPNELLSSHMVKELLTPQSNAGDRGDVGLGLFIEGKGPTARFGHSGDNLGYQCRWLSGIESGQGCVVMTNSDNGEEIIDPLISTIALVYEWPDIEHKHGDANTISTFYGYEGMYQVRPGYSLTITRKDNNLFLQTADQQSMRLTRGNDTTYILPEMDSTITFVQNESGAIPLLILRHDTVEEFAWKQ